MPARTTILCSAFLALAALTVAMPQSLPAALVTGVTATASSNFVNSPGYPPGDRQAPYTVNGSGLSVTMAGVVHNNSPEGNMWMTIGVATDNHGNTNPYIGTIPGGATSDPADPNPEITFDLGGKYRLSDTQIWNYNESAPWNERGAEQVELLTKLNAGDSFTHLATITLAEAPGSNTYLGQNFSLGNVAAGFVEFRMLSNYDGAIFPAVTQADNGNTDYGIVGLSEVQFNGISVPEPSSIVLGALGAVALAITARRRRCA